MKKISIILLSFITLFLTFIHHSEVQAAAMNFSVQPILPNNQVRANEGYFDLLLAAGEQQTLTVELSNSSNQSMTLEASFNRATTNMNGLAVYSPEPSAVDASLKYNISEYVKVPKEITVPAKTKVDIKVEVSMPTDKFEGILAGGITFKEKTDKAEAKKAGVTITNAYQYVVALLMRQQITAVNPELSLHEIKPSQVNARNVINANLQNSAMTYLNQMVVETEIKGISDSNLTYQYDKSALQMAPNSNFDLPIPISIQGELKSGESSQPLKAGKYHLTMTVYGAEEKNGAYQTKVEGKTTNYKYKWIFNRDFEITGEEVAALNASDPTVEKVKHWNWWLILLLVLFILLLILFWLLWRRRKKEEKDEEI